MPHIDEDSPSFTGSCRAEIPADTEASGGLGILPAGGCDFLGDKGSDGFPPLDTCTMPRRGAFSNAGTVKVWEKMKNQAAMNMAVATIMRKSVDTRLPPEEVCMGKAVVEVVPDSPSSPS